MNAFFIAGMGIAVFIEFLLIAKKKKSESDNILTVWMFLILVHMFFFYLGYTGDAFNYPFLLGWDQPFPLLHGVMLYIYVSFLTEQVPANKKLLALHFAPALMMYVYLAITFFPLSAEQKVYVYMHKGEGFETYMAIRWYAIALSGIAYVSWSTRLLRNHQKNIRDQFSDVEKLNLQWLQILTFGLGAIWFLVIFLGGDDLVFTGVVVFVFLIGFFGIRQANIFTSGRLTQEEPPENEQKGKYQKSGLTEEASEKLHQELKRLMTEEALYKQSELSINELSSRLGVHPNYLSQVINQKEEKNFYDFVNTYRVEEFKRLIGLQKNQQFTLLSLAYDCGFSSKTSFNRCFKKATGHTPSEYVSALTGNNVIPE